MNEFPKPSLAPAEQLKLKQIGDARTDTNLDRAPAKSPLLISGDTLHQLLLELNVYIDPQTQQSYPIVPIEHPDTNPTNRLMMSAQSLFDYLGKDDSPILRHMDSWLIDAAKAIFQDPSQPTNGVKDVLTMGAALTLRAFQIQSGNTFLDALKKLEDKVLFEQFKKLGTPETDAGLTITERAKKQSRFLPAYQLNLRNAIDAVIIFSPNPQIASTIEQGAVYTHKLVEAVWGNLYPATTPQQPKQ